MCFHRKLSLLRSVTITRLRLFRKSYATQSQTANEDYEVPEYDGPELETLISLRKSHIAPSIKTIYDTPLLIHHGHMQWLYDHTGKKYLDMFGGIVTVSVGHCHPYVVSAVERQMRKLWHTTNIYLHPNIHKYAEKLCGKFPGDLQVAYFVNSGSEANDLALLLARASTGNFEMISFEQGYHGMSPSTMGLTAQATWNHNIPGTNNGIHHVKHPNPYKGLWGGTYCRTSPVQTTRNCHCDPDGECEAATKYLNELKDKFLYSIAKGKCAGMIAESMQGVGGAVEYTKGYIKSAAKFVRDNGGLFISDEVQTGFGRTGKHFWGFESHEIVPDIVTMAKGIGNGFPLAAIVTTAKIAESLSQASHFNTFGGNPLSCAAGMAVLEVIEQEGLQSNALEVGTYFLNSLKQLRDNFEIVGDVRGQGLMIAVELVENKKTRAPLPKKKFDRIWNETKNRGVLFGSGGLHGNVFRIKPPMCITKADADLAVNVLAETIKATKF